MKTRMALAAVLLIGCAAADDEHSNPFAQMGFLAGDWRQTAADQTVEEHWVGPVGGVMAGMTITWSDKSDSKTTVELMKVETRDGKIVFVAVPQGQPETVFPLKESDNGYAVFENLGHDFPQRVIYAIGNDAATLDARIEGRIDGADRAIEWHYKRITVQD